MADNIIKIGRGGTITIPQEIRNEAELNDGDHARIEIKDGKILIEKVTITPQSKNRNNKPK